MSEFTSPYMIAANGPDMSSSRALPPASSIKSSLSAGLAFSRKGVSPDIQERMIGVNRRLDSSVLEEILSCPKKEEGMMLAAAAQMLSPGGPSQAPTQSPFGQPVGTQRAPNARRGMDMRPKR